jgi:uncharacterized Zn-finger protein
MLAKPLEIPGKSIRPPDKPGSKRCPHCGRRYRKVKKKGNKKVCPYCGKRV